jgi:hypothetical protein
MIALSEARMELLSAHAMRIAHDMLENPTPAQIEFIRMALVQVLSDLHADDPAEPGPGYVDQDR